MSDIASAVERAKAVAAKLTAAAKASGQLPDGSSSSSAPPKRRFEDDIPTSGYSKRENLYSSEPASKRSRDDPYADAPASGFRPKHGLGSDDATQSFLAKLGLSGGLVSTKVSKEITIPADMVGLIIGRGGETLKRIQAESGVAKIQFESQDAQVADPSVRRTTLIGTEQEVERANQMIMDLVSGDRKGGPGGSFGGDRGGDRGGGSHYGPRGSQ
ncbi:UNVERIFIED_CONTAM: Far upstream element-binding protein 1, partial [Siphonaria sp. JEL0065]